MALWREADSGLIGELRDVTVVTVVTVMTTRRANPVSISRTKAVYDVASGCATGGDPFPRGNKGDPRAGFCSKRCSRIAAASERISQFGLGQTDWAVIGSRERFFLLVEVDQMESIWGFTAADLLMRLPSVQESECEGDSLGEAGSSEP
jgi:hypothetical protein